MLSNAPVAPTLAVNDLERARRFYEEKLGFEVEAQVAETVRYRCGNGTGLAIFERPMTPIDRTVAAFEVANIETEVTDLRAGASRSKASSRWPAVFVGRFSKTQTATSSACGRFDRWARSRWAVGVANT